MSKRLLLFLLLTLSAGLCSATEEYHQAGQTIFYWGGKAGPKRNFTVPHATREMFTYYDNAITTHVLYIEGKNGKNSPYSESLAEHAETQGDPRPYRSELIRSVLHICDRNGKDIDEIGIPQKFGADFGEGRYLSKNFIILRVPSRVGLFRDLFIDLRDRTMFGFVYDYAGYKSLPEGSVFDDTSPYASPDGERLLLVRHSRALQRDLIYVDGVLVWPAYDANPLNSAMEREAYQKKEAALRETLKTEPSYPIVKAVWSPDHRQAALISSEQDGFHLRVYDLSDIRTKRTPSERIKSDQKIDSQDVDKGLWFEIHAEWDVKRNIISLQRVDEGATLMNMPAKEYSIDPITVK